MITLHKLGPVDRDSMQLDCTATGAYSSVTLCARCMQAAEMLCTLQLKASSDR